MTQQRMTKQAEAIANAIKSAGRPLSIEEILATASGTVPTLGLRTVYRVVRRLQEMGEVASVSVPGGSDRYETASIASKHHHHFHCNACDRFFDLEGCPGGMQQMLPEGFKLQHHEITLSGLCASCC